MTPELQNTLAALAAKLGVTIEYLWPKLVGHAQVGAWSTIIFCAVGIVGSAFALRWCIKTGLAPKDELVYLLSSTGLFVFTTLMIALPIVLTSKVPDAIFPEAAAIKSILPK